MYVLSDKTILLISPQSWGKMFVSKHHYAVELAKKGNRVYFLNPPLLNKKKGDPRIKILSHPHQPGLFIIDHRLSFPYNLKFHFVFLFHLLMQKHVRNILKKIESSVDIVWSFDLGNLYPFSIFSNVALKIFHPVDEPPNATAIHSAEGAHFVFSVTQEILKKYEIYNVPKHFINHGVDKIFLRQQSYIKSDNIIRVGVTGNLWRPDIDREILLQIIKENSDISFECWGSLSHGEIKAETSEAADIFNFVHELKSLKNVILHGAVNTETLAKEIQRMDAFLICYDVVRDQSKGTNYHKVMEFLSTGKVIISNNISTYKNQNNLVQMTVDREDNKMLPLLFQKTVNALEVFNSDYLQQVRKTYASNNTYENQIIKIEAFINSYFSTLN